MVGRKEERWGGNDKDTWSLGWGDYNKMKIYLLILALTVLSQAKFRHLSNISIMTTSPPLVKSLTPNELAIQYGTTAITLNISNEAVLQTIALPAQSTIQLLPSQSLLLYINQDTIYQTHPTSAQYDLAFTVKNQDVKPPINSFGKILAAPTYGDNSQIKLIGPNPWDSKTLTRTILDGENIKVGSDVSFVSEKQFYFAAGGVCNGADGSIYLHKSDGTTINKVYEFPLRTCSFDKQNKPWSLSFYPAFSKYRLFTYASQSSQPKRYTSQLISNKNGPIEEVAHFDIDRLIGVTVASNDVFTSTPNIYTADNLFCRVLQHDILNHQHQHLPSPIKTKPKRIFVAPSQKFIISVAPYYNVENADSAILQRIDIDGKFSDGASYGISTATNIIRGELLADFFVVIMDDSVEAPLSIWDIQLQTKNYPTNLKGVVDFCVSNMDVVFVLTKDVDTQILGAYKMTENVFTKVSSLPLVGSYTSLNCLDGNNVLLTPNTGSFMILQYADTGITEVSNMAKDPKIHTTFNYIQDILIFTNKDSTQTTFYDYKFAALPLSFNLPPNSVFKILQPRKDAVIIAIGSEVGSYSSLQYYKVANSVISYAGTFPYLDDGVADLSKTILFASRGILHIEYQEGSTEWATYFDLANPPQKSIGYFFDDKEKDCSQYDNAIFNINWKTQEMIVLNKNNNDYPIIEKYAITDKLTKIESYPLTKSWSSLTTLRLSSSSNEIIVSGVNTVNRNYMIEVRNINLLSKVIYSKEEHNSLDGKTIKSVDIFNNLVASSFSNEKDQEDTQQMDIYFRANTQGQIAVKNDVFSAITLIATCPNCNIFAFTGTLKVVTDNPTIIASDFLNPSSMMVVTATCLPDLLAVAPGGRQLAWKCPSKQIFTFDFLTQSATPVIATFTTITELSFLDEKTLLANIDGAVQRLPFTSAATQQAKKILSAGLMSSYAIDYSQGIYAVAANATTIQIYSITTNDLIDTYTLNNNVDISSLSFASNGDLVVAKSTGSVIILTQAPCSNDKNLIDGFCVCKQLYEPNGDLCTCDYVRQDDGSCICDDGYYFDGNNKCNSCSAMCSTCNSDGAFDCGDYSVWFFLIIIGGILLIGGVLLVVIFKLKKRKDKADTMYTQDKSKMSEPFVSQKQKSQSEQVMRKSSKE